QIAEAGGENLTTAPEEILEPRSGLRHDEPPEWQDEGDDRERVGQARSPRDLDVRHHARLATRPGEVDERGDHRDRIAERGGAELQAVAPPQDEAAAAHDGEAPTFDLANQLRLGRPGRRALHDLRRPEKVEILLDGGLSCDRSGREAPGEVDRDVRNA